MDDINSFVAMIFALVLRLGIPIGLTALVVLWMRRMDARWQADAEKELAQAAIKRPGNSGCWKNNNCTSEAREKCPAYARQDTPCWQVFRENNGGHLRERCLGCEVFRKAPIPVSG